MVQARAPRKFEEFGDVHTFVGVLRSRAAFQAILFPQVTAQKPKN